MILLSSLQYKHTKKQANKHTVVIITLMIAMQPRWFSAKDARVLFDFMSRKGKVLEDLRTRDQETCVVMWSSAYCKPEIFTTWNFHKLKPSAIFRRAHFWELPLAFNSYSVNKNFHVHFNFANLCSCKICITQWKRKFLDLQYPILTCMPQNVTSSLKCCQRTWGNAPCTNVYVGLIPFDVTISFKLLRAQWCDEDV